jgi:two-component system, cell cycle sensor histidine kinase and response regulator CckA
MLQLMRVSISKNAALNVDLPERSPMIRANAAQIRQVAMNLITNASEALGGKEGAVSIALKQVHTGGERGYLRLEISDTGCGMTEEVRAGIFDPFFTTKGAGRGLGLASVQGIIRSHGGAISVASAPGRGSCFEILLPCSSRADEPTHDNGTAHSAEAEINFTGTLLLIDDEEALLFAVARMLRKKGFSVLEARDGKEGIDHFRRQAGNVKAVLLDMTLPGMPSGEILEELRRINPDVNVILSSAYGLDKASAALREAQRLPYIRKPYLHSTLVDLIRRTCSDRQRGDEKAERRSA